MNYGVAEDVGEHLENQHKNGHESGKTDMKILTLLSENPKMSIPELASALNMSVGGIRYQIDKLKKSGALERIGADKGGYWKVK